MPPGSTFWLWIERLARRGFIGGYACGSVPTEPCLDPLNRPYVRPNANLTRGQLAKLDAQAAGYTQILRGQTFADVPLASTFWVWVEQVAGTRRRRGLSPAAARANPACRRATGPTIALEMR